MSGVAWLVEYHNRPQKRWMRKIGFSTREECERWIRDRELFDSRSGRMYRYRVVPAA